MGFVQRSVFSSHLLRAGAGLVILLTLHSEAEITFVQISDEFLQQIAQDYGRRASKRFEYWDELIQSSQQLPDLEKLQLVNKFFNSVRYASDQDNWGEEDYWATPIEFLAINSGDCEDYTLAKYFTLRALGVADEKLRLTYVKAIRLNQAHMVLTYYADISSEPLVLDNLTNAIKPASSRPDLQPVYSFNGDDLWLSKERGRGQLIGKADKLDQWALFLTRQRKEITNAQSGNS